LNTNTKIKQYLESNGIRQEFVATKIKMKKNIFNNIVNGKRRITADELKLVADALKVDANIFLN
jgi:transcriptional regulator with XRE-family HTH domain